MTNLSMPRLLKPALVAGAMLSLGGCIYGGAGYYGDGYVNNHGYDCDPYAPFADYYACDYGYGFANIGYGGGWYDQYYYPGYGIYIFDRGGRRHAMRDSHRRYWARQRAEYGGHHDRSRHVERRDRRYDRNEATRDQRRSVYRGNADSRDTRRERPAPGTTRRERADQAAPVRNQSERTRRTGRRPAMAVEQPQARPQPAARPPRAEGPRRSPRTNRNAQERLNDD